MGSLLKDRSYAFALRVVGMCRHIAAVQKEFVLSKQVLRSGTSIGANIEEAFQAESKADFVHKLSIANKEAFETHYWLRLMKDSKLLTPAQADPLLEECDQLQRMLVASIKTSKGRSSEK